MSDDIAWIKIKTTTNKLLSWRKIAKQSGLSLPKWVENILNNYQNLPPWPAKPSLIENDKVRLRFWSKVKITSNSSDCWFWTGYKRPNGFGEFKPSRKYKRNAHKLAYEDKNGIIESHQYLTHTCGNPGCCNPGHIEIKQ